MKIYIAFFHVFYIYVVYKYNLKQCKNNHFIIHIIKEYLVKKILIIVVLLAVALIVIFNIIVSENDVEEIQNLSSEEKFNKNKKECDENNYEACYQLALQYNLGEFVQLDEGEALKYYELACNNGEVILACINAGAMYLDGTSATVQNMNASFDYLTKSCPDNVENGIGCANLGSMYYNGRGTMVNYEKAAALYDKSCKLGISLGCHNLAILYSNGKGVEKDLDKSLELVEKACSMGDETACLSAKSLKDQLQIK